MTEPLWQLCPPGLKDDEALAQAVLGIHQTILDEVLAGDPMLNTALPAQIRALRRVEDWRVLLLLTPWMLARLLFPADAVFEAWNQVIRVRDENMEKARRDCPLQKEISRRELLRRLRDPGG